MQHEGNRPPRLSEAYVTLTFLHSCLPAVADYDGLAALVQDIVAAVCSDASVAKQTVSNPTPVGGQVGFRVSVSNTVSCGQGGPL